MWRQAEESAQKTKDLNNKLAELEEGTAKALANLQKAGDLLAGSRANLVT